jgi:hypothetical protein
MRRRLKSGDVVLANSFCGIKVKIKLTRRCKDNSGWWGTVFSKSDVQKLKNMSVPIDLGDETYVFDFHIIKKIHNNT